MTATALGSFLSFVLPRFDQMFSGDVAALTPWLVLVIWVWAAIVMGLAARRAAEAMSLTEKTRELIKSPRPEELSAWRATMLEAAGPPQPEVITKAWQDFDQSLVLDERTLYSTLPAQEFFNEQRFAPLLMNNRFIQVTPTALTTLGLLGTFLGLTVGLRSLNLGSTTDELRVGIQTLVDGAALGFTASLWGVAMSLATNLWVRRKEHVVTAALHRLQSEIDQLFTMRPAEHSLSEIAAESRQSREALQVLHEKVGTALQEAVAQVGVDTSQAVTQAIQDSLAPVMKDLAARAADQSAEVFKEITAGLTASFQEIGVSLAEELRKSSESMRTTIDYMGEQLSRHSDEHLARLKAVEESSEKHLLAVTEATDRQLTLLDESLPRIIENLERTAGLVGSATDGMSSVVTGLNQVTKDLSDTSATLGENLNAGLVAMRDVANKTATAAQGISAQQESLAQLGDKTIEAVDLLRQTTAVLAGGFQGMQADQDQFLAAFKQSVEGLSSTMAGWLNDYATQVTQQTAHRMSEWNTHTERFTSTMVTAAQALSDAIDELDVRPAPTRSGVGS